MGKRGNIKLVIPKNNASKTDVDAVLTILEKYNGKCSSIILHNELINFYSKTDQKFDHTTISHRSVTPRYFGLLTLNNGTYELSEFGDYYIRATKPQDKIDCIMLAISSITFGRDNNGVSSDSNIEAPIVFLKLMADLKEVTINEVGIVLYKMEVDKLSYIDALNYILSCNNLQTEKLKVKENGGGKLFDLKFNLFFTDLGIAIKTDNKYKLSKYMRDYYYYYIKDLSPFNTNIENDNKEIIAKNDTASLETILNYLSENQKTISPEIKVYNSPQTGKLKIKKLSKKIGFKNRNKIFNSKQLNQIGWIGERYIFNLLKSYNEEIIKLLNLKPNEKLENINWFNNGCTMDENWSDQSVGHGCDIEVETSQKRTIKLEVKTSFSSTPFFTATTNELISMSELKQNYFIIKVNNIKVLYDNQKPSVMFINDPINLLKNINSIKEISLYI